MREGDKVFVWHTAWARLPPPLKSVTRPAYPIAVNEPTDDRDRGAVVWSAPEERK